MVDVCSVHPTQTVLPLTKRQLANGVRTGHNHPSPCQAPVVRKFD